MTLIIKKFKRNRLLSIWNVVINQNSLNSWIYFAIKICIIYYAFIIWPKTLIGIIIAILLFITYEAYMIYFFIRSNKFYHTFLEKNEDLTIELDEDRISLISKSKKIDIQFENIKRIVSSSKNYYLYHKNRLGLAIPKTKLPLETQLQIQSWIDQVCLTHSSITKIL